MKLNKGVLVAVVVMMGALGATGCSKASGAGADPESGTTVAANAVDDSEDTAVSEGATGESTTEYASAMRRFGGGRGRFERRGERPWYAGWGWGGRREGGRERGWGGRGEGRREGGRREGERRGGGERGRR